MTVEELAVLGSRPFIALVEDDESLRIAISSLLRSFGWTVYTFACAEEYLASPRANYTSCLITDVQMPGLSGMELQSVLTTRGLTIPTIIITAFPDDRMRRRSLEAGAVCFLTKPFDEHCLIQCVDAALQGDAHPDGRF